MKKLVWVIVLLSVTCIGRDRILLHTTSATADSCRESTSEALFKCTEWGVNVSYIFDIVSEPRCFEFRCHCAIRNDETETTCLGELKINDDFSGKSDTKKLYTNAEAIDCLEAKHDAYKKIAAQLEELLDFRPGTEVQFPRCSCRPGIPSVATCYATANYEN